MSDDSTTVGIPAARSPLVGRVTDLRDINSRLGDPTVRLLTLTGPGGVGKTRLALAAAADTKALYGECVWIVSLAGVREPQHVPRALLAALRLRESGEETELEATRQFIGQRPALLVIDNMEQVIGAGLFLSDLLLACPVLKLLVTSRSPLQLSGEIEYPVSSLRVSLKDLKTGDVDLQRNPAITLFIEKARSVRPDFAPTGEDLEVIAEICTRLDGLPLAIELAASRLKVLSPSAILSRLTHSLRLLTGGPRDAPLRLQTMRDAIGWSYDLLNSDERRFFRALGVFRGSFSLPAAGAVAGASGRGDDPLDKVMSLVNQSLLVPMQGAEDEPRFAMLETIREFAMQSLNEEGELDDVLERHARWLVAAVKSVERSFFGSGETTAMDSIERDVANVGGALSWLVDHDPEQAGRLVHWLWYYWGVRGYYREGLEWIDAIRPRSEQLTSETLALVNRAAGFLNWALGRYGTARTALASALQNFTAAGDKRNEAMTRVGLGSIARDEKRFDEASAEFASALEIFDSINEPAWAAYCLSFLGSIARSEGRLDDALELLERGFAITKRIDYPPGMSPIVDHLGDIAREQGDFVRAFDYYKQSMPHWLKIRDPHAGADSLIGGAEALASLGRDEDAVEMIAAATAAYRNLGMARSRYGPAYRDETVEGLRRALGAEKFESLWSNGEQTGWEEVAKSTIGLVIESPSAEPAPSASLSEFGLTPRELQIVDLLIEGHSNAEIGEALFISPRTAGTHIANVFSKMGVSSRAAAVAVAMRSRERANAR